MNAKYTKYNLLAKFIAVLLAAFTLKHFYSTASVNELRWILAPTTFLVELVSGRTFNFEMHTGYMSSDHSFLIASSCAGVNFMITAFLMLSVARLWRGKLSWKFIPAALGISYATTIVANTVRISTALHLQYSRLDIAGLNANQLHRLEGILIYFGFLLLLFLLSERTTEQTTSTGTNSGLFRLSRFILPLLVYYTTTLGIPLANALYRQEFAATTFPEHSGFVLFIPLLLILPMALIGKMKHSTSATLALRRGHKNLNFSMHSAAKARDVKAWANGPGNLPTDPQALKAQHEAVLRCSRTYSAPSALQRQFHR